MIKKDSCKECGITLPADGPKGMELCPACLLGAACTDSKLEADIEFTDATGAQEVGEDTLSELDFGTQVGPYTISYLLGRGGMGYVYEAKETETGRRVALKILANRFISTSARKRFLQEGRIAATINHPNSVYVYRVDEIDGQPIIVMELVNGGTLSDKVKLRGPLTVEDAVDAMLQLIDGLEEAHSRGILHRDIKPSNCFIDKDGTVKIGDYGISISKEPRWERNLTATNTFIGTPHYCSPEQLRGDQLDVRSDIYALGSTLYYLLTGKTVFDGLDSVQLLAKTLSEDPETPRTLQPAIPEGLARTVLRCLNKSPDARYASYNLLRKDLQVYSSQTQEPVSRPLRVCAYFIDLALVIPVAGVIMAGVAIMGRHYSYLSEIAFLLSFPFAALFFGVLDAHWASPGKKLLGISVKTLHDEPLGWRRACLRTGLFYGVIIVPMTLFSLLLGLRVFDELSFLEIPLLHLLFFLCSSRKNGFSGAHDLIVGTRVVKNKVRNPIQIKDSVPHCVLEESLNTDPLGPYKLIRKIDDSSSLYLGFDPILLREVWMTRGDHTDCNNTPIARINSSNHCLRWICGETAEKSTESWDAWEALAGQPLLNRLDGNCNWAEVRCWCSDLLEAAGEIEAESSEGFDYCIDRIWVLPNGHVKLFPFSAPHISQNQKKHDQHPDVQSLLNELIERSGLNERNTAPLHSRVFFDDLAVKSSIQSLIKRLKPLLSKNATVTRRFRLVMAAPTLIITMIWAMSVIALLVAESELRYPLEGQHWDTPSQIIHLLDFHQESKENEKIKNIRVVFSDRGYPKITHLEPGAPEQGVTMENILRYRLQSLYKQPYEQRFRHENDISSFALPFWEYTSLSVLQEAGYKERFVEVMESAPVELDTAFRDLSDTKLIPRATFKAIDKVFREEHSRWWFDYGSSSKIKSKFRAYPYVSLSSILTLALKYSSLLYVDMMVKVGLLAILSALLFKRNLMCLATGVAILDGKGNRVGRMRRCLRYMITYSPIILATALHAYILCFNDRHHSGLHVLLLCGCVILFIVNILHSVMSSGRSIQDRVSGTYPVCK